MSFSDFKTVPKVADKYKITTLKGDLFSAIPELELSQNFIERVNKALKFKKTNSSEYFLCEFLIAPVLFEVIQNHSKLNIWSHDCTLEFDNDLTGVPDYIISYKGDLEEYEQLQYPLLTVGDAKRDDFAYGWAQTLAEMIAMQKLNKDETLTVFGIVTNGTLWEFSILKKNIFTQHSISYAVGTSLNKIAGIINYIYTETTKNVEKYFMENNIPIRNASNI